MEKEPSADARRPTRPTLDPALRGAASATCHGRELQQRLRGHFDGHARRRPGPVPPFDGGGPAPGLAGPRGEPGGLRGGLLGAGLARGDGVALLRPGGVRRLLTLGRIGNLSERGKKSSPNTGSGVRRPPVSSGLTCGRLRRLLRTG